jgi:hypothetical protein
MNISGILRCDMDPGAGIRDPEKIIPDPGGKKRTGSLIWICNTARRLVEIAYCNYRDSVTRFLTSGLFHQTIPPGPLINGLKPFCIWLQIREDIRLRNSRFWHQQCQ